VSRFYQNKTDRALLLTRLECLSPALTCSDVYLVRDLPIHTKTLNINSRRHARRQPRLLPDVLVHAALHLNLHARIRVRDYESRDLAPECECLVQWEPHAG